eukprot:c8586_g1_i1.p1 GENE.c8586_g1_i1~~c8586_g1_i1.p1  ORF type:complete len:415 (+),score=62.38 c8586_g1_i1:58-1302(+)
MRLEVVLASLVIVSGLPDIFVGLVLTDDGDLTHPDVFDSSTTSPVRPYFRKEDCDSNQNKCHVEPLQVDNRFFYMQAGRSEVAVRNPIVEFSPLLHTDTSTITMQPTANQFQPNPMFLKPEETRPVELSFPCTAVPPARSASGLFLVKVTVPVVVRGAADYNVTWYFRKACLAELASATGLSVSFGSQRVITNGQTVDVWRQASPSSYDVGYDPADKDVAFSVSYRNPDSGELSFGMMAPVFDKTIIKRVVYKGQSFSSTQRNVLRSGAKQDMIVHVTCQPHSRRDRIFGDITVGLIDISDYHQNKLRSAEFKFSVECPTHSHKISPKGVFFIVLFSFVAFGFVGDLVYNVYYNQNRGLDAIPLFSSIRSLFRRQKKGKSYFPRVEEDDDANAEFLEESIPAARTKNEPEYGAI